MRAVGLLLAVALSGAGPWPVVPSSAGPRAPDQALEERIARYRSDLAELRERLGIPGLSVAVARDGEIVWSEGMGWADRAARRPARPETPYRIASITKTMTAAVLVALHRRGALDLDAPVASLLEEDEVPTWMWSWSAYLLAEGIADERPGEARRLLERVLEEGVDEGGLFEQVRTLLEELSADPDA